MPSSMTPRFDAESAHPRARRFERGASSRSPRATADLEVIIPVLNEEARIEETLRELVAYLELQSFSASVVVVDNGCADRTLDRIDSVASERVPIRVIACSRKGKGAAIRRAVMTTRARMVGFVDADLSTPIATIGAVMALLTDGHRVVIASRRCDGAEYVIAQPLGRRMGGMVFRRMTRTLVADVAGVADTQCGFKFFHTGVAKALFAQSQSNGFAFDVEILGLALRAGIGVTEVPVSWTDVAGSSLNPLVDGPRAMRDLVGLRSRLSAAAA